MKVLRNIILLYALLCGFVHTAWTTIQFGSKDAGIKVSTGSNVDFNGVPLSNGTLYNNGGTISGDASVCSNMTIATRNGTDISAINFDGSFVYGTSLTLAANDRLQVAGGVVDGAVIVDNGDGQSTIEGFGSFSAPIKLVDSSSLNIGLASALTQDITRDGESESSASLFLLRDLTFAPGSYIASSLIELDCQGYALTLGGNAAAPTTLTVSQSWADARVVLSGPLALDAGVALSFVQSAAQFDGNNNTVTFGLNSYFNNNGFNAALTNVMLSGVVYQSLQGAGSWLLNNVTLIDSANSITVVGGCSGSEIDFFGKSTGTVGHVIFAEGTNVSLNKNCTLYSDWNFAANSSLNGSGCVLDLTHGTITLSQSLSIADVTLMNVDSSSFDNRADKSLMLSNVNWFSTSAGGIRINPLVSGENVSSCALSSFNASQGDIFNNVRTNWSNASIELLTDVVLNSDWHCRNTVIDGAGKVLDLAEGTLFVSNGTLSLRNVVLANVTSNSFGDDANNGVINLSNVTIKLSGDADFSLLDLSFVISGPVTFITGSHTFTTWNGIVDEITPVGSYIDGITAYYDTLSAADAQNVIGFRLDNDARLLFVTSPVTGDILVEVAGTTYLGRTEHLAADAEGYAGRALTFDVEGTITYNGLGRSLVFPLTASPLLSVTNGTTVITENITLQSLVPAQLDVDGGLYFGNKTTIRLTHDWTLQQTLTFGSSTEATNEVMVLDLNGFTINLDDINAGLVLQGGSGNTLRICNGRLTDLSGTKLLAQSASKIIFENIECALTHTELVEGDVTGFDYVFQNNGILEFQGHCLITGRPGVNFRYCSTAAPIIAAGATLSVMYNMTYWQDTNANFTFAHETSTLELIGATFTSDAVREGALEFATGVLIVDHKTTIDVGSAGITFGNGSTEFDVQIRPSASINVAGNGTLRYRPIVIIP